MGKARRRHAAARAAAAARPEPTSQTGRSGGLAALLLVVAGLLAYHNAMNGAFVLDDVTGISENPTIRRLWPLSRPLSPPPKSPVAGRPVVNLSLAVNYALGELDVTSYHLFNVGLHVLAGLVLFGIVRRTLESAPRLSGAQSRDARGLATATALLWVVHPLASESVDYTIQRTELLMALFLLLTIYCAIRGFQSPQPWRWHAAALVVFALGLGSKEIMVVAPVLVLAYDWLFWSASLREALGRRKLLYAGYAGTLVLFVLLVGTRLRGAFRGIGARMSPIDYALTQCGAIVHYLRLAFWPHPLVGDYSGWPIATSVTSVLPALSIVLALVGLTLWGVVRRAPLAFLGLWFFAILAPTSSFRPITSEIVAERRMYLPLVAVVALAVLGGRRLLRWSEASRAAGVAVVATLAVILAVVTIRRNPDYRSFESFWSDVLKKRPENHRAHMWIGNDLRRRGRLEEALSHLSEAARLAPRNTNAQNNLGALLVHMGRVEEGVARYREAIRVNPANALAHNNLGTILANRGEMAEAIEHFRAAVRIDPGYASAHDNLAHALLLSGQTDEAIAHLETAVRLQPDLSSARRTLEDLRAQAAMSTP